MDDYLYMVTFQIRTFGRNICNGLTPFMDFVYILCILLQKNTEYQLHFSKFPMYTINIVNVKLTDGCDSIRCGFKCVANKLISNYGLSLQPDKLYSYYCSFYGSQLRHLTSSGSKSCYVLW